MDQVTSNYVQQQMGRLKQEVQAYSQKLGEMEMEKREHLMVIDNLGKLPADRRCYRMVGGVLVERTVKEVLPAVKQNLEGIEKVMENLQKALQGKQKEMQEFQAKIKAAGGQAQ